MRLAILGGSSPFTVGLFDALTATHVEDLSEIMLHGRDEGALCLLARYAAAHLPDIKIEWTTDMEAATDGFDIVQHQIRYGGLEVRGRNEDLAHANGYIADETLGPAALHTACTMRGPILRVAETISRGSPNAHVLNLTNPMGLAMVLLHHGGIPDPIGVCELPETTAQAAATTIGVERNRLGWAYSGLNHRGFLHTLRVDGVDVLGSIAARAGGDTIFGGLDSTALMRLGGLPTKYFCAFAGAKSVSTPGRAQHLMTIRRAILTELARDSAATPPSLAGRAQPWWDHAVVPLLQALSGEVEGEMILNLVRDNGLAEEGWCTVSHRGAIWIGSPPPPVPIGDWVLRFRQHEAASMQAVLSQSPSALAAAIALDPLPRPVPLQ